MVGFDDGMIKHLCSAEYTHISYMYLLLILTKCIRHKMGELLGCFFSIFTIGFLSTRTNLKNKTLFCFTF